jgi:hypothetical protein
MLLNVLVLVVYDPGRAFFGVFIWAGRVGVPPRWRLSPHGYRDTAGTTALLPCIQDLPVKICKLAIIIRAGERMVNAYGRTC